MSKWAPGMRSPNPRGRPKGIIDKRQRLSKAMLEDADAVVSVVMERAKMKICPPPLLSLLALRLHCASSRQRSSSTSMLSWSLSAQVESVLQGIADGKVAPDVGKQIIEAIGQLGSVRQVDDLEARIVALEGHHG